MNYNNRLSSTLANNIRLDSSKEYEAEKIAGGNIIWLVNRPAGVKIYVNSTPDRSGALVLNEANRGYKWEQLGNYGDLKLYDNFYLWTEGKNINGDLIELQISPNADIITPILGNTADKIDKISEIENIGNNVKFSLYEVNNDLFNSANIKYLNFINGDFNASYDGNNGSSKIYVTKLVDLSTLTFDRNSFYRIRLQGHCDFGGSATNQTVDPNSNGQSLAEDSIHLDIIDLSSVDFNTNFTKIEGQANIDNIYKSPQNFLLEKKKNHFNFYGLKRFYSAGQYSANHWHSNNFTPGNINFDLSYIAPAFTFITMKDLIFSLKSHRYKDADWWITGVGFHFSIKIQIEVLSQLPNSVPILQIPYINNNI